MRWTKAAKVDCRSTNLAMIGLNRSPIRLSRYRMTWMTKKGFRWRSHCCYQTIGWKNSLMSTLRMSNQKMNRTNSIR